MTPAEHMGFLREAFDRYLVRCDAGSLEPELDYLPYDFEEDVSRYQWRLLGGALVEDELRELTNILNNWHDMLLRWHAWNEVLAEYAKDDAWHLRREFLEPLVHHCLLSPSAARDTFLFVATNSFHQLRLGLDSAYKDFLVGDPASPGKRPKHLTRPQKESRLADIVAPWSDGESFIAQLKTVDDDAYRELTFDYRNRASHAIAPRLALGHTQTITRFVEQAKRLEKQEDGTYQDVLVPGQMTVCYGYGGTPPLELEEARQENLEQYSRARLTYESFRSLLLKEMSNLSKKN